MTTPEITRLDDPIDVMALIHKAFRSLSGRIDTLAEGIMEGGDIGEVKEAFDWWLKQLVHHAAVEDEHMTAPLRECQQARDNETEHAELAGHGTRLVHFIALGELAGVKESVREASFSLEEDQHRELEEWIHEVENAFIAALGNRRVAARTRRHLYRKLMALRVLELDHFENEEAFVVSLVRQEMDETQQLDLVKRLLIDESADNPRWVIDWLTSELGPGERDLVAGLEKRFQGAVGEPA